MRNITRAKLDELEAVMADVKAGHLDEFLMDIQEALNERRDVMKAKVAEMVKAVYGEDYEIQPQYKSAPQPEPRRGYPHPDMTPQEVQQFEEREGIAPASELPEPIVSGTVYDRIAAGQGVEPVAEPEMIITEPDGGEPPSGL